MKVHELIQMLRGEDPNADVHISYDYGDHWHTQVAPKLKHVEELPIKFSEYHGMQQVVEEDDDDGTNSTAVILFAR